MRAAIIASLVLASATARADGLLEKPADRQGYYLALDLRSAVVYSREDGDGLGPWNGFSTGIALGQMITERLGAGIAIDFGGASGDGENASTFALQLAGQAVIARNTALHAAVGLGVVSLDDPSDPNEGVRGAVGAAYSLGISYDWFPWGDDGSGGFAVTPNLVVRAVPSTEVDAFMALAGVSFSYWTGLPKNQLDLPPDKAFR